MQSYLKDFSIEQLNIQSLPPEIFSFFDECNQQNLTNNNNVDSIGFNKRQNEAWWVAKTNNKIISISGTHRLPFLGKNAWRVLVRSATLKEYRGTAGPFSKSLTHEFTWGHILKHQIDYCKQHGGTEFYFTTNIVNSTVKSNEKTNKLVERILVPQGYIKFEEQITLYDTPQNVWKIVKLPVD